MAHLHVQTHIQVQVRYIAQKHLEASLSCLAAFHTAQVQLELKVPKAHSQAQVQCPVLGGLPWPWLASVTHTTPQSTTTPHRATASNCRRSAPSLRALSVAQHWLSCSFPQRSMRPPLHIQFEARAAASAKGQHAILGGCVSHPAFGQLWFSESFSVQDFRDLGIPVSSDMASEISCYEALAQKGLIIAASSLLPSCSVPILLPSASDNTGAEVNACFTTSLPLAPFS